MRTLRSIGVASAAGFGALLSGLVAFISGAIALIMYGAMIRRAGFLDTWANGALYAGRGLVGLLIIALLAAAIGAISWAVAALIYNWIAGAVGGVEITLE